jgi:hypothetical protein
MATGFGRTLPQKIMIGSRFASPFPTDSILDKKVQQTFRVLLNINECKINALQETSATTS